MPLASPQKEEERKCTWIGQHKESSLGGNCAHTKALKWERYTGNMYLPGACKLLVTELVANPGPGQGTQGTKLVGKPFLLLSAAFCRLKVLSLSLMKDPDRKNCLALQSQWADGAGQHSLSHILCSSVLAECLLYVTSENLRSNPLKYLFLVLVLQVR